MGIHPRVRRAQRALWAEREAVLASGARHVGWKIARDFPEVEAVIGDAPVLGYLTTATQLAAGGAYESRPLERLRAEVELALVLDRPVAPDAGRAEARASIGGIALALEIVDVRRPPDDLEGIVLSNCFHRAFVLHDPVPDDPGGLDVTFAVNGAERCRAPVEQDVAAALRSAASLLAETGQTLRAGDVVLGGALTHAPVERGDALTATIETVAPLRFDVR